MIPILHHNLERLGFPGFPREVRSHLETASQGTVIRNALQVNELVRVLKILGEASVPVLPLKGVTLAASLHGDVSLRVSTDIDILVPAHLVVQALQRLLEVGYQTECGERYFQELYLRNNIEFLLTRDLQGSSLRLELHWGILWRTDLDRGATADLWAEARPCTFFGARAHAMSPEWELLFLAVHAARHRWQGLRWLVDLHEVCVRGGMDWNRIREKAGRFGWKRLLSLGLSSCHALFQTPVPSEFLLRRLPRSLRIFPRDHCPHPRKNALDHLHLLNGPLDKFRYALSALFVPTLAERRLIRLPSRLGFFYYPLRAGRVGIKWIWRLCSSRS